MVQQIELNQNQRVLVTGGAGFIGSALVRHLIRNTSVSVLNVDKLTYAAELSRLEEVSNSSRYEFSQIDIANLVDVTDIINKFKPSIIIHLAAESHVDRSILGPLDFIQTNVLGTFNLLEGVRTYLNGEGEEARSKFRFLHVSTDEVYGDLELHDAAFTEQSQYAPSSPYAASKASADHLVKAWARTYAIPTLITNCSNNYGPHQFPEKLIPLVIQRALQGKSLPIYGNGLQIRDWLYVDDHIDALCQVIQQGEVGETYNIGSKNEVSNIVLVKQLCSLLEKYASKNPYSLCSGGEGFASLIEFIQDRPGHDRRYAINNDKIVNTLKWQPKVPFEQGLERTLKWYVNQFSQTENLTLELNP